MDNLKEWLENYTENAESVEIKLDPRHIDMIQEIAELNNITFSQAAVYVLHSGFKSLEKGSQSQFPPQGLS